MAFSGTIRAETLAFIGAPRAAELSDKDCSEFLAPAPEGKQVVCVDRAFALKYQVLEPIKGDFQPGEIVSFIGLYHYWGIPTYTSFEPALVVLERVRSHLVLRMVEYVEERDAGWLTCDEWPEDEAEDCPDGRFAEQVVDEFEPGA